MKCFSFVSALVFHNPPKAPPRYSDGQKNEMGHLSLGFGRSFLGLVSKVNALLGVILA